MSLPSGVTSLGDRVVFFANSPLEGRQIWVTDGTPGGTRPLTSIAFPGLAVQEALGVLSGGAVWRTSTGLWRSDGTEAGTYPLVAIAIQSNSYGSVVSDGVCYLAIRSPSSSSLFQLYRTDGTVAGTSAVATNVLANNLVACAGRVYYVGSDPSIGQELWSTDGTVAGTSLAADLTPAPGTTSLVTSLGTDGSRVFFAAHSGFGAEPHVYNPATGIASMIKDIYPGAGDFGIPYDSSPYNYVSVAGRVYFQAYNPTDGGEMYVTDGTAAGTHLVANLVPGPDGSFWEYLGAIGNKALFFANSTTFGQEVWADDGVSFTKLTNLDDGSGPSLFMDSWGFMGGKFVFEVGGGASRVGPLVTDGTPAGTMLLADAVPQSAGASRVSATGTFEFFRVGTTIYRYDGTGATAVADLPGSDYSCAPLASFNGLLFAIAGPNVPGFGPDLEPWVFDPATRIGLKLREIHPGTRGLSSLFNSMAAAGGRVVFTGPSTTGIGVEPFGTDGTPSGTALLGDLTPGSTSSTFTPTSSGPRAMCIIGNRWWSSDGTPAGTTQLPLFAPTSSPAPVVGTLNGRSIIAARHTAANVGYEPYITDGTVAGTMLIKNITIAGSADVAPFEDSNPSGFVEINGRVYFNAQSNGAGYELWASDGTPEGTYQVKDINPGTSSSWSGQLQNQLNVRRVMAAHNGLIYFAAQSSGTSPTVPELYKTDGTSAGTEQVVDLNPGSAGSLPDLLTSTPQGLFFAATVSAGANPPGRELFITDGTAAGTRLVKNITAGAGQTSFGAMCAVGGASTGAPAGVVFACRPNDTSLNQLWFSDGTDAGTVRLGTNLTIETQFATTFPPALLPHRGRAYFVATTNNNPTLREVWRTDGTQAGTCMLANVIPDPSPSITGDHGKLLTLANNRLFVVLESPMWGREVHMFNLCPADYNNSGGDPTIDDLFLYFNAYFSSADGADIDHSGAATIDDLFLYISAYFTGCQ